MCDLEIRVEFDIDRGWLVEWPQIYETGIEYETESTFELKKDAIKRAKHLSKKTQIKTRIYKKSI